MDDTGGLLEAFRVLYASLEKLRHMDGPDMLLPVKIEHCHSLLETADVPDGKIETVVG
jgi:hypothetical protein